MPFIRKAASIRQAHIVCRSRISIGRPEWSPMKCRSGAVVSQIFAACAYSVVAARFHDVNLARGRPFAVGQVLGHHPDCRPQPIAARQFCIDFDASKSHIQRFNRSESCRVDWVQVIRTGTGSHATPPCITSAFIGGLSTPKVLSSFQGLEYVTASSICIN